MFVLMLSFDFKDAKVLKAKNLLLYPSDCSWDYHLLIAGCTLGVLNILIDYHVQSKNSICEYGIVPW